MWSLIFVRTASRCATRIASHFPTPHIAIRRDPSLMDPAHNRRVPQDGPLDMTRAEPLQVRARPFAHATDGSNFL
jgi:hypothetical protein